MRVYVLDISALVRLYVPDGPIPEGTEEAIEATWRAEAVALAPELALAEVA
jgi:predicted nucleic acid-binding protein